MDRDFRPLRPRRPRRRATSWGFWLAITFGLLAVGLLGIGLQWLRVGRVELGAAIVADALFILAVVAALAWRSG